MREGCRRSVLTTLTIGSLLAIAAQLASCVDLSSLAAGAPVGDAAVEHDDVDAAPSDAGDQKLDAGPDAAPVTDPFAVAVLADGPASFFRLDETSGASCSNAGLGPATCSYSASGLVRGVPGSGSSRKGVRFEQTGGAITFPGALPYAGTQKFTVEIVVSFDLVAEGNVFKQQDTIAGRTGQLMFLDPSEPRLHTETWRSGSLIYYTLSPAPPPAKTWMHVVFGYDNAADADFLYIDGVVAEGAKVGTGLRATPNAELAFGGSKMTIDDVAIYDKVLTASRIAVHSAAAR